jgi:hypothetical protein
MHKFACMLYFAWGCLWSGPDLKKGNRQEDPVQSCFAGPAAPALSLASKDAKKSILRPAVHPAGRKASPRTQEMTLDIEGMSRDMLHLPKLLIPLNWKASICLAGGPQSK